MAVYHQMAAWSHHIFIRGPRYSFIKLKQLPKAPWFPTEEIGIPGTTLPLLHIPAPCVAYSKSISFLVSPCCVWDCRMTVNLFLNKRNKINNNKNTPHYTQRKELQDPSAASIWLPFVNHRGSATAKNVIETRCLYRLIDKPHVNRIGSEAEVP